jgi:hypothetical protein
MSEIERFFEAYRNTGESNKSLAPYYHAPCLTLRGDGSFVSLQSVDDVARFFQTLADTFDSQGLVKFPYKDFSAESLGPRSAFVTMTWEALKADGTLGREWRQSYNLVRFGEKWEIVLSTIHVGA